MKFLHLPLKDLLFSIRSRVAAFSLLATLIPSITLGWLSYDRNATVLREKAEHEIVSAGQFAAREIDLWIKDRIYEIRVIGSSHLVTENLERMGDLGKSGGAHRATLAGPMQDYLRSVGTRFAGYASLQVTTADGEPIAGGAAAPRLPEAWLAQLRQNQVVVGEPVWRADAGSHALSVVVPLRSARGRALGNLVAVMDTSAIEKIIDRYPQESGEMFLANALGQRVVLGKAPDKVPENGSDAGPTALPGIGALTGAAGKAVEYRNHRGLDVVGTLQPVPDAAWGIVVERERRVVLAQVYALRSTTILLVFGLLTLVGIGAYGIGLSLVHPLDRLVGGADRVASGDLTVNLPVVRRDELGKLTERFNEMTAQLRANRDELAAAHESLLYKNAELEELSVTDALTGLHNRRYLMDTLTREFEQRARNGRVFTLLMADLDHFKRINDTYGHPAGDAVLMYAARVFREEIRSVDLAARFGGEEFTLLLIDSDLENSRAVAERIRARIATNGIAFDGVTIPVTISIGLAQVASDPHDTPADLISRADAALYAAKDGGRNRVHCDDGKVRRLPARSST
jgi:diguanylate cyclase (GGDEF)-like protein